MCIAVSAWAGDSEKCLFFYEARGLNLLAASPADGGEPVFLIFPDTGRFPERFANEVGEGLVPGDAGPRAEAIRDFQTALNEKHNLAVKVTGVIGMDTIQKIRQSADSFEILNRIGPFALVNLNKALRSDQADDSILTFLQITTGGGQLEFTDEQINRCRPTMERNLTLFVESGQPRVIRGKLRGVFGLASCSEDRSDTDNDGLLDVDEINLYGSDPKKADSDGDGLSDGREIELQRRGLTVDVNTADTDGDGLSDAEEIDLREKGIMVDPARADTDGDGLNDRQEIQTSYKGRSFDPTNPASFPGGLNDAEFYEKKIAGGEGCGTGSYLLLLAVLIIAGAIAYVIWKQLSQGGETAERPQATYVDVSASVKAQPQPAVQEPVKPEQPESVADEEVEIPIEVEPTQPVAVEPVEDVQDQASIKEENIATKVELQDVVEQLNFLAGAVGSIEEQLGQLNDFRVEIDSLKQQMAEKQPAPPIVPDADEEATMQGRLDAMGRVLSQINERLNDFESQRPASMSEEDAAGVGRLHTKISEMERMVVRSMSEWGRLLNDLDERIKRLEQKRN